MRHVDKALDFIFPAFLQLVAQREALFGNGINVFAFPGNESRIRFFFLSRFLLQPTTPEPALDPQRNAENMRDIKITPV